MVLKCFLWAAAFFISVGGFLMIAIMIAFALRLTKDSLEINRNKYCRWMSTDLSEYNTYCGNEFHNAEDGNPVTDWAKYCPYCGKEIKE